MQYTLNSIFVLKLSFYHSSFLTFLLSYFLSIINNIGSSIQNYFKMSDHEMWASSPSPEPIIKPNRSPKGKAIARDIQSTKANETIIITEETHTPTPGKNFVFYIFSYVYKQNVLQN